MSLTRPSQGIEAMMWPLLGLFVSLTMQVVSAGGPGGRVVDGRSGAPVVGAEVAVVGRAGAVITDEDGRFVWAMSPDAPAVIIITFADGRLARPVRVKSFSTGSPLTLVAEFAVNQTVTVTGVSGAIDASDGASLMRIGRQDLALRHPATLVQALENVPGVSWISEGQNAVPVVRGMARGRTLILVDGARATSERRSGPNAAFVDPDTIQSLEIARGPGAVAYGSDAFGGVIALQLRGPNRSPGWHGRMAGTLAGGAPEQRGDLEISRGYKSGAFMLGARAREFDDYRSPSATVIGSAWRDSGVRAAWAQDLGHSQLAVGWNSDFGRDLGRPRSDFATMRVASPIDDSHRLTVSWNRQSIAGFRNIRIDALAGGATQQTDQDQLATTTKARSLATSRTSYRDMQFRVVAERGVGRARFQTGMDMQGRYGLRTRDTAFGFNLAGAQTSQVETLSIADANRTGVGVFADATIPIAPRIRAAFGGRIDTVRNENKGGFWGDRSVSNTAPAGSAALTVAPFTGASLTAQVARGFRDPTLSDRFYRGPVGRGVVEGNPDLVPETSLQMDLTTRVTVGPVQTEISAYRYRITDLIERYSVNQNLFRFRNRGAAIFRGMEIAASLAPIRGFVVEVTGQTSRGRDAVDGTPLDDVAPASVAAIIRHAAGSHVTSYVRLAAYRAHQAAGPSEVATPGYRIVDAGASWQLTAKISVHGIAKNLFDAGYYANSGPRWVYAPGRQGVITFAVKF